ncbi:hypothetical protein RHS03_01548, partial [Rhizoctonia solani]
MQRKKQRGTILEALESAESTEGDVVGRADGDRLMYVDPDGSALPARAFVTCPNPDGSQGLAPFRKYRAASSPFSPTQPKLIALGRIAMALSHNPLPASSTHTVASSNRTICLLKHAYSPDNDGNCLAPFFTSFESRMVRSRDDRRGAQRARLPSKVELSLDSNSNKKPQTVSGLYAPNLDAPDIRPPQAADTQFTESAFFFPMSSIDSTTTLLRPACIADVCDTSSTRTARHDVQTPKIGPGNVLPSLLPGIRSYSPLTFTPISVS